MRTGPASFDLCSGFLPAVLAGELRHELNLCPEFVKHVAAHQTLTPFFDQACRDLGPIAQVMMGPLQNLLLISDMQEIEDVR